MSATIFDISEIETATEGWNSAWFLTRGSGKADVFLCKLEGKAVAVKKLPRELENVDSNSFLGGLAALGSVDHPNVLPISGVCVSPPIIVYPLRRGGSLASRLALENPADPPLTAAQRVAIALGAARGLAALHAKGIVHMRVKSANILLDDASVVRGRDEKPLPLGSSGSPEAPRAALARAPRPIAGSSSLPPRPAVACEAPHPHAPLRRSRPSSL